jgi:hypothetical protein
MERRADVEPEVSGGPAEPGIRRNGRSAGRGARRSGLGTRPRRQGRRTLRPPAGRTRSAPQAERLRGAEWREAERHGLRAKCRRTFAGARQRGSPSERSERWR